MEIPSGSEFEQLPPKELVEHIVPVSSLDMVEAHELVDSPAPHHIEGVLSTILDAMRADFETQMAALEAKPPNLLDSIVENINYGREAARLKGMAQMINFLATQIETTQE